MAEIATTLEQLKAFLSKFFEHEPYGDEYLKMMLSQYDIKGNEPVDKDLTPVSYTHLEGSFEGYGRAIRNKCRRI